MAESFQNNFATTLSAAITTTDGTSVSVAAGFAADGQYRVIVDAEIMIVTAGANTTTWTVTRGAESTTAATHLNGATVTHVLTAGAMGTLLQTAAPVDAEYLATASNGDLSAEVVIPGLAGSADIAGAGGAGTSEEYDTSTTGLTWSSAPSVENSDTTVKSHLYIKTANATEILGTKSWSPGAGAFDVRCKVSIALTNGSSTDQFSPCLLISNSNNSQRVAILFSYKQSGATLSAYTYESSTWSQRGESKTYNNLTAYLRISRDGSNNISYWFSNDGHVWTLIVTYSFTVTVANVGFRLSDAPGEIAVDWLRTSV